MRSLNTNRFHVSFARYVVQAAYDISASLPSKPVGD